MAVMMIMEWPGVTREQYDSVCTIVDFERDVPPGGLFHVAAVDAEGLRVTDVWERAEDFQAFVEKRLMPGVQQAGISGEPRVQILPAIKVFAPGYVAK
ncbi:hypothetical protein HLB44_10485 [Aquincola sp. S2]|uniref:ABM domain-containing protein n=1 Tax=Pseudaquabacterium terrae TaxID=2732868 RepID=A0ABX2EFP1_9BURK|nr:hypothetical protein [Aquabacterium terrae]NRF67411.1 hypothetical protein [Aquabacterium terrae]